MRKRLSALFVSAVVISGIVAFAQAPSGTQSTPPPATMLRMRGTIDKYDVSTRTLFLSTSSSTVQFPLPLASAARIRRDGQTVDASELAKLSGYRAAVRYTDSGGSKTVESVHVFGKAKG